MSDQEKDTNVAADAPEAAETAAPIVEPVVDSVPEPEAPAAESAPVTELASAPAADSAPEPTVDAAPAADSVSAIETASAPPEESTPEPASEAAPAADSASATETVSAPPKESTPEPTTHVAAAAPAGGARGTTTGGPRRDPPGDRPPRQFGGDRPYSDRGPRMDRNDRGDRGDRGGRGRGRVYFRRKVDKIKTQNLKIDYKYPEILRRFVTEKGKILPRRITGTSAKNQRRLIREIKRARSIALLPMG